jgi:hypothetical protein
MKSRTFGPRPLAAVSCRGQVHQILRTLSLTFSPSTSMQSRWVGFSLLVPNLCLRIVQFIASTHLAQHHPSPDYTMQRQRRFARSIPTVVTLSMTSPLFQINDNEPQSWHLRCRAASPPPSRGSPFHSVACTTWEAVGDIDGQRALRRRRCLTRLAGLVRLRGLSRR